MQISDGPSQMKQALFGLNCCFESKCIISYQPDIEDFKTTMLHIIVPIRQSLSSASPW